MKLTFHTKNEGEFTLVWATCSDGPKDMADWVTKCSSVPEAITWAKRTLERYWEPKLR